MVAMRAPQQALGAAATTGMLVGAAMVSTSAVSQVASPATLAFLRYAIGLAILAVPALLALMAHWPRYRPRDAAAIMLLGVAQFAVLILLLNYALVRLPASTCALVFASMPLFTLCLAVLTGRERFHTAKLLGVALAVAGVLLGSTAAGTPRIAAHGDYAWGMAALLGATVVGATTSILYGPYMRRYPALPTSSLAMAASVVFLALYCWLGQQPLVPQLTAVQWGHVVFIGLSSGLGYFCLLWALGQLDASRVIAFQALGPVTAAVLELLLHHRWPSIPLLAAMALVMVGLAVATRTPR